jgi:hypothetical protein
MYFRKHALELVFGWWTKPERPVTVVLVLEG